MLTGFSHKSMQKFYGPQWTFGPVNLNINKPDKNPILSRQIKVKQVILNAEQGKYCSFSLKQRSFLINI